MQRDQRRMQAIGLLFALVAAGLSLSACGNSEGTRVLAASSLQDVLPEILDAYAEGHDGATFETQFGGSQALATQIELGAAGDIFISANEQQFARLEDEGLVEGRTAIVTNQLVLAVALDSSITEVEDLAGGGVRIAVAAPDVPVGALTERAFELLDAELVAAIRSAIVTEDPNVRVTLSRVELGEADAAFVYRTDVAAAGDLTAIELPIDLESNTYVGGVFDGARSEAADVLEYLASDAAASIWREAGFEPVGAR